MPSVFVQKPKYKLWRSEGLERVFFELNETTLPTKIFLEQKKQQLQEHQEIKF